MGAGKGKTKRAQAPTTKRAPAPSAKSPSRAHEVKLDLDKWREFAISTGITHENLHRYYLEEDYVQGLQQPENYEKVMTELFADLIEIGALTLPEPFTTEDFVFETDTTAPNNSFDGRQPMKVTLDGHPELQEEAWCPHKNWIVGGGQLKYSTMSIQNAVNALLKSGYYSARTELRRWEQKNLP